MDFDKALKDTAHLLSVYLAIDMDARYALTSISINDVEHPELAALYGTVMHIVMNLMLCGG